MNRIFKRILLCAAAIAGLAACETGENLETEVHAPRLISIVPGTGYAGCTAIISGEHFSEKPEENIVTVDGAEVPVTAAARNRLTLTMPPHGLGDVEVKVSVNGMEAPGSLEFTYSELPEIVVKVTSVRPDYGYAGDMVTIAGENFSAFPSDNRVTFGGVEAEVVKATETSLEVTVPEHERGNVEVAVTVDGKTSAAPFRYVELMVESNVPESGAEGVEVTIIGEGFSEVPAENIVTVNGVAATVKEASLEELVVVIPDNPEGTYPFVVKVGDRTVTGGGFSYTGCWRVETVLGDFSAASENKEGTGKEAHLANAQDIVLKKDGSYLITLRNKDHAVYTMSSDYTFTKVFDVNDYAELLTGAFPWGCALDSKETLYVVAKGTGKLLEYTSEGVLSDCPVEGLDMKGMNPMDVILDREDNLYLLIRGSGHNGKAVKIKDGKVLKTYDFAGMGLYESMLFSHDYTKIFLFGNGTGNIRMIDLATDEISIIAGTGNKHGSAANYTDGEPGQPLTATFNITEGAVCLEDGTIIFGDCNAGTVREFRPGQDGDYTKGTITTIAGKAYERTQADGKSSASRFYYPNGMCIAPDGKTIYMLDGTGKSTVRKLYYQ